MARIYNIGDFKVEIHADTHGFTYTGDKECHHRSLAYREEGQIITCKDCGKQIGAWWAFMSMVRRFVTLKEKLDSERAVLEKDKARNLTHSAALLIGDAWRRRKYVPTCPHCHKGILPPDGFGNGTVRRAGNDTRPLVFSKVDTPHPPI